MVETYHRIGRWGTCVSCPIDNGIVYPEKCVETTRSDHQHDYRDILFQYNLWRDR